MLATFAERKKTSGVRLRLPKVLYMFLLQTSLEEALLELDTFAIISGLRTDFDKTQVI